MLSNGVSVERFIKAPAASIFALLADPSKHQEIDGSGTVREAVEPSRRVGLGDTFGMQMKAGAPYTMVNTVIELEPDRRIAWQARPSYGWAKRVIGGRIWRYELEPRDGGTLVRETWDISQEQVPALVWGLRRLTRVSMERTLKRIEELVA